MHVFTQGVHHVRPILPKLAHVGKVSKKGLVSNMMKHSSAVPELR